MSIAARALALANVSLSVKVRPVTLFGYCTIADEYLWLCEADYEVAIIHTPQFGICRAQRFEYGDALISDSAHDCPMLLGIYRERLT